MLINDSMMIDSIKYRLEIIGKLFFFKNWNIYEKIKKILASNLI